MNVVNVFSRLGVGPENKSGSFQDSISQVGHGGS